MFNHRFLEECICHCKNIEQVLKGQNIATGALSFTMAKHMIKGKAENDFSALVDLKYICQKHPESRFGLGQGNKENIPEIDIT